MSLFSIDQTEKKRIIELYRKNSINIQNEQILMGVGGLFDPMTVARNPHTTLAVLSIASLTIPIF